MGAVMPDQSGLAGYRISRGRSQAVGADEVDPARLIDCDDGPSRDSEGSDACPHPVSVVEHDNASVSVVRCAECDVPVGSFYRFDDGVWQHVL
jgi:hypothetical protein